jgi:transposase InsO family protein
MSIIDKFSKFGYNFIIQNKKAETILGNLIQFISIFGKPNSIHTDNGREFRNKLFENYCKLNNINIINGRPFHPQSQGCIENFNKQIKNLLENRYLENPKKFSIYNVN